MKQSARVFVVVSKSVDDVRTVCERLRKRFRSINFIQINGSTNGDTTLYLQSVGKPLTVLCVQSWISCVLDVPDITIGTWKHPMATPELTIGIYEGAGPKLSTKETVAKQKKEIAALKAKLSRHHKAEESERCTAQKAGVINNNITNNTHVGNVTNTNNINIYINPYGQESLDHISTQDLDRIIRDALGDDDDCPVPDLQKLICGFAQIIHRDPHNANIKVYQSKKDVKIYDDDGEEDQWKITDMADIVNRLPRSTYTNLFDEISRRPAKGPMTVVGCLLKDSKGNLFHYDEELDDSGVIVPTGSYPVLPVYEYDRHFRDEVTYLKTRVSNPEFVKCWAEPLKAALMNANMNNTVSVKRQRIC